MGSFPDYYNSIIIDRVPYKHKNWQLHGILMIPVQIALFSPHTGFDNLRTYAYFYWRTHDFGHVYVDTYAKYFPKNF